MSIVPIQPMSAPTEQTRELVADPKEMRRMSADPDAHPGMGERMWGFEARLDPNVTFEEFMYWAKIEREMEMEEFRRYKSLTAGQKGGFVTGLKNYFTANLYEDAKKKNAPENALDVGAHSPEVGITDEKTAAAAPELSDSDEPSPKAPHSNDLDADWRRASRALRTAGWGAIFYLITTDILGWGQTAYVYSNTGYGLGVGIFVLMGLAAGASGFMIWRTFLALDSSRFPIVTFGDAFFRLYGSKSRHFINVLQSLQMFFSVAVVQLGQSYVIAQLGEAVSLCFVVCGIISLVVGMASGYMRALKVLGWFCNASVWINIITFIIIMAAAGTAGPDPQSAVDTGPLNKAWQYPATMAPPKSFIGTPPPIYQPTDHNLFAAKFNGINSMVYAYSGAILFMAFLSEMRHPMDFWKAMFCAQLFISVVYIVFGAYVYSRYGQYSYVNINQVVEPLRLQVVSNILVLITGWLAIFLYFNVGMKTVYVEVGQEIFKLPPISSDKGKKLWWALGPFYWILAFIVAMSIPQFSAFTNLIGGLFSLNFTYSFSGVMYAALKIQAGAALPGEGFDPGTGVTTRHDQGMKRWVRGFKKSWMMVVPVVLFSMAGFAASGMGSWAAIEALIVAFQTSYFHSWTCSNPFT